MRLARILARRCESLFRRSRAEADLRRELDLHLDQLIAQHHAAGMSDTDARRQALRDFGPVDLTRERCRDTRRVGLLEDFARDLSHAVRLLAKSPGFTLAAVLTLALGLGANSAVFTVIDSVLLRPLPFPDAGRLLLVTEYRPGNVAKTGSPLLRYQERAARNTVFEQTAAYWNVSGGNGAVFGGSGSAQRLRFAVVTNSFFPILGIRPALGRAFTPAEEVPGTARVFLAGDALWRRAMNGDPQAIGRVYRIDGQPFTLAGVLPPGFDFPAATDLWLPVGSLGPGILHDRVSHQFWMLGRLRAGVPMARARAQMNTLQLRMARANPATDANWLVHVRPLLDEFVGNVRVSLWTLFGAVILVLLIAWTNVVNLLLARAVYRAREFAVRAALGAARGRLVRQALTETLLLVACGASLGILLAQVSLRALAALGSASIPRFAEPRLGLTVLAFTAGLALVTALAAGTVSGMYASGPAWFDSLRQGRLSAALNRRGAVLRNALVVAEVALSFCLLSGAGLMLRSFQQLRHVPLGFHPERLLSVRIALPDAAYPRVEQRAAFLRRLLEKLNAAPGIHIAAATDRLPLSGETNWGSINIAGRPAADAAHAPAVEARQVSAAYFRALGIPLWRGREFTAAEMDQAAPVAIVNQEMARQFWPGADPIGQRVMSVYHPGNWIRIVGVAGDIKDLALDAQSPPEIFTPYRWWNAMNLVLRAGLDPAALVDTVRREVAALDPQVPVYDVAPLADLAGRSVARQRFELFLLAVFAFIALALAAIGIYGVLAFAVGRRSYEIGLRLALGAHPRGILALILSQGMRLVLLGLAFGLAGSLLFARLVRELLYQVSPADPPTLAAVAATLAAAGALACWIPARRAMRTSPLESLRGE